MRPSQKGKDTFLSWHKSCVQITKQASWTLALGQTQPPSALCKVSGPSLLSGPGRRTLQGAPGSCPNKPRTLGVHVEKATVPALCPQLPPGKEHRGRLLSTAIYRHTSLPAPGMRHPLQVSAKEKFGNKPTGATGWGRKRGERGLASVIN